MYEHATSKVDGVVVRELSIGRGGYYKLELWGANGADRPAYIQSKAVARGVERSDHRNGTHQKPLPKVTFFFKATAVTAHSYNLLALVVVVFVWFCNSLFCM